MEMKLRFSLRQQDLDSDELNSDRRSLEGKVFVKTSRLRAE